MIGRRKLRWIVPLIIGVMLLAACGSEQTQQPETTDADEETRFGGTLVIGHSRLPDNIDANVHASRFDGMISSMIQDPLVWQPEAGTYEPGLAESWEISDDYTSVTLHLRDDVVFHDGEPFNAEALKFTFERILDPETNSLQVPTLSQFKEFEIIDDYTVTLHFTAPQPLIMNSLSSRAWSPASPKGVEELGADFITHPVGTGPLKVVEWPTETSLVLERFEDYNWGPSFIDMEGKAFLERVEWKILEETTARQLALESGEVDMVYEPAWDELATLEDSEQYSLWSSASEGLVQVYNINVSVVPTSDLRVRQAMLHATNQDEIVDVAHFGFSPAAYGPISRPTAGHNPAAGEMYPYDPEKAAELLDEAGWKMNSETGIREKDGQPLRLRLVISHQPIRVRSAELVQAQWKQVGIDLEVEVMAYSATVKRYADNDYELGRLGWGSTDAYSALFTAFHSSQIEGGGQFNRSKVADAELDALIEDIGSETNFDKRIEMIEEAQLVVMEKALVVPLYETAYHWAGINNIQGFRFITSGSPLFHGVYFDPPK